MMLLTRHYEYLHTHSGPDSPSIVFQSGTVSGLQMPGLSSGSVYNDLTKPQSPHLLTKRVPGASEVCGVMGTGAWMRLGCSVYL